MLTLLQTKWAALTIGALTYSLTTWLCLQPQKQFHRAAELLRAALEGASSEAPGPSWTFHNPEVNQLVTELKDERAALARRAKLLDDLEARLNAERQEICSATQTVYRLRTEFDSLVTRITDEEAVNLKKLARVYASMTPEGASRILKEMDDEQIVKILAIMKESESAPILESLGHGGKDETKRVALISNRLRLTLTPSKKTTP
jgi:flagellar motility protein MotE (MotC chaperone)